MSAANRFRQRTALIIFAAVGILAFAHWISNQEPGKSAAIQVNTKPAPFPTGNGCYCVLDIQNLADFTTNLASPIQNVDSNNNDFPKSALNPSTPSVPGALGLTLLDKAD